MREHNIAVDSSTSSRRAKQSRWTTPRGRPAVTMHDGATIVLRSSTAAHDAAIGRPRWPPSNAPGSQARSRPASLSRPRGQGTARGAQHHRAAAERAHGKRTLPRLEGLGGHQRIAEIGPRERRISARPPDAAFRRLQLVEGAWRNVANSNGFVSVALLTISRLDALLPVARRQCERQAARDQTSFEKRI